jgi:predicted O-linked N-acetylglucosamine transferase (SPINDLY family)
MRRMGLAELVANTDEAFIETAVELAGNGSRLSYLRGEIANRRNILFRDTEAVRALEQCLIEAIGHNQGVIAAGS